MAYLSGDELFLLKTVSDKSASVHGKPLRVAAEDAGYCQWLEEKSAVYGGANKMLQEYLWAHPPSWRKRISSVPQGTKPPLLVVLDTETTSCFDDKKDGTGLPKGGPRALVADGALARRVHLLDVAWSVVDPTDFSVVESYQSMCKPVGTFEYVFDQKLYQEAEKHGRPLKECMQALMDTLRRLRTTHEPYVVCHNVAFDRKVIAYSLAVAGMHQEYFEFLATPMLCTMASAFALEGGVYDAWARRTYPDDPYYASRTSPKSPKLERLHVFCTGKDVIQTHRAAGDVEMLCACLPDLVRRGWFVLPNTPAPAPALAFPNAQRVQMSPLSKTTKKVISGRPKVKPSPASKRTSVATPVFVRRYFLRSHGPAP